MSLQNQDWQISKSHESCHTCKKIFDNDQVVYSSIIENEGELGLVREDFCTECWAGKDSKLYISFWKTIKLIDQNKKAPVIDDDILLNLFERLNESDSLRNQAYAYLLSLILMRKRVLSFDNLEISDNGLETMVLSYKYKKYGEGLLRVDDPQLSTDDMNKLNEDLSKLVSFGSLDADAMANDS
ncbi:MAG: hypothetical protein COA79_14720 [Planctomycetota bacterium]|nr:MAG: hypothetical protein COA79_14720 [Planctomycetota bacterium]